MKSRKRIIVEIDNIQDIIEDSNPNDDIRDLQGFVDGLKWVLK